MNIKNDIPLAQLSSFNVGGSASLFADVSDTSGIEQVCKMHEDNLWVIGEGTNILISDYGLPGLALSLKTKGVEFANSSVTVESGTHWDDFVSASIGRGLWGIELMSGIPGSVGAAVVGNIAAYGQAVADTLDSIEVYDVKNCKKQKIESKDLDLEYRHSNLQKKPELIVLNATFKLSNQYTSDVQYQKIISVAEELDLDLNTLEGRRKAVMIARKRAGSLIDGKLFSAGSFYKNPIVSRELADYIMGFEEHGATKASIVRANKVHGGNAQRVSAALVLLAAGFRRGQTWGSVQLHPESVLKIVNLGGAKAQDIYNVHLEISLAVKEKLDIELEPEVKFLGKFD